MSVEYTVLECAQSAKVSGDNASWTNCVHRTGIDLLPGDTIGLEMAALHSQGADGDTIEISGEQTDADVQDNKCILDLNYTSTIVAVQLHASRFETAKRTKAVTRETPSPC